MFTPKLVKTKVLINYESCKISLSHPTSHAAARMNQALRDHNRPRFSKSTLAINKI